MHKKIYAGKFWLAMGLCFIFALSYSEAFARDRERQREVVRVGHERYNYHDGRFYRPGWFWFEIVLVKPPIGAVVTYLPFGHRTTVVRGATYYYYNDVYYTPCPSGYIVVPAPIATPNLVYAPSAAGVLASPRVTVIINVPNANGSYTPVTLIKGNNGYIGPQGEYYPDHPTLEQLKALYGK